MRRFVSSCLVIASAVGCSAPDAAPQDASLGAVSAALSVVPDDVHCVRFWLTGSSTMTRNFAVAGGADSTITLGNVNPGELSVRANAYTAACGSVNNATASQWTSEAITVEVRAGLTSGVSLVLRPTLALDAHVDFASPAQVIAAGRQTGFALLFDGTLRAWGANEHGQLGDGTTTDRALPVAVTGLAGVAEIAVGDSHACALLDDGTASCWGANESGQLGDGTTNQSPTPTPVQMPAGVTFTHLAAGSFFNCAVGSDAGVYCWGRGTSGQLGNGGLVNSSVPGRVAGETGYVDVMTGTFHACGVLATGRVNCWGTDWAGQFGNGNTQPQNPNPVWTYFFPVVQMDGGDAHTCAISPLGALSCSGIGSGPTGTAQSVNVPTTLALGDVVQVSAGLNHTCAVTSDGVPWCFGVNESGQLGDGATVPWTITPHQVVGLSDVAAMAAGAAHTCALKTDGSVWCWGSNDHGALGDGTVTWRYVPVQVKL
jgi:hypothetical protein